MEHKKRSGKKWLLLLAVLLIAGGTGVALYPWISNYCYEQRVEQEAAEFHRQILQLAEEPEQDTPQTRLHTFLQEENQRLYREHQSHLTDPWSYQQPTVLLTEYGLEDEAIGYLFIPKLEQQLPIYLGANHENLRRGVAHLTETSYPVGGENTNCVLAGHRGYSGAAMLRYVDRLKPGDSIVVENFYQRLDYTVQELVVVEPEEADRLLIREGEDTLTLLTCHPPGVNTQRLLVVCHRAETPPVPEQN